MNEQEVLQELRIVGAIVNGHFVYSSGKHGPGYVNKDAVYIHTGLTYKLCLAIAQEFACHKIDVVLGPAIGGVILSHLIADHLTRLTGREVLAVYAEKGFDGFVLKRGYAELIAGARVLVVEDVLTTGGSVRKVIELVRSLSGYVIGLGVLCNRGGITLRDVGCVEKIYALVNLNLDSWDEADCPLCVQGVPINTDVGKGHEFLARKNG